VKVSSLSTHKRDLKLLGFQTKDYKRTVRTPPTTVRTLEQEKEKGRRKEKVKPSRRKDWKTPKM